MLGPAPWSLVALTSASEEERRMKLNRSRARFSERHQGRGPYLWQAGRRRLLDAVVQTAAYAHIATTMHASIWSGSHQRSPARDEVHARPTWSPAERRS